MRPPVRLRQRRLPGASVPGLEECQTVLAFTPWNEFNNWRQIRSMVVRYPFTAQAGHAEFLAAIDGHLDSLRTAVDGDQARALLAERTHGTVSRHHNHLGTTRQRGRAGRRWSGHARQYRH